MKDEDPHRIEDNEEAGEQTKSTTTVVRTIKSKRTKYKLIVAVGFDDNLKEFDLWDHLYDVETDHFELDAVPDYKNRIQYYEIRADRKALRELRLWLLKNDFKYKYKVDKT